MLESKPKVLILGIGENRMGDDGAGPYITFQLDQRLEGTQVKIINGGIVPEDRLDEIVDFQPELLLVVDVIDIQKPSGTVELYDEKIMLNYLPISSHSMPLPVFMDRIKRKVPGVTIKLVGIVPYSLKFLPEYKLFDEVNFTLDDKDENLNIPFYDFHFSPEMEKLSEELAVYFLEFFKNY